MENGYRFKAFNKRTQEYDLIKYEYGWFWRGNSGVSLLVFQDMYDYSFEKKCSVKNTFKSFFTGFNKIIFFKIKLKS